MKLRQESDFRLVGFGDLEEAIREVLAVVEVAASERKLADGLLKLIDDACTFEAEAAVDQGREES